MAYANALGEVSFAHATPYVNGVLDRQQIEALQSVNQYAQDCWVCWGNQLTNKSGQPKMPIDPATMEVALRGEVALSGSFEAAVAKLDGDWVAGVGVMLKRVTPGMVAVDLDHVRNAATGELSKTGAKLLRLLKGRYVEVSPSGTGLRAILYAGDLLPQWLSIVVNKPGAKVKFNLDEIGPDGKNVGVELFWPGGHAFVRMSGRLVEGHKAQVGVGEWALAVLDWVREMRPQKPEAGQTFPPITSNPAPAGANSIDANLDMWFNQMSARRPAKTPEEVLAKLQQVAAQHPRGKLAEAMQGNAKQWNGDRSTSDQFLIAAIIREGADDLDAVYKVAERTQAKRDKWNERRSGYGTWFDQTAYKALETEVQKPDTRSGIDPAVLANVAAVREAKQPIHTTAGGKPKVTFSNVVSILRTYAPKLFAFDEFRSTIYREGSVADLEPGGNDRPGRLEDDDIARVTLWLGRQFQMDITDLKIVQQAIRVVAKDNRHDPVKTRLLELRDKWVKDGRHRRLDTWLTRYMKIEDEETEEYVRRVGRHSLVGAVRRVFFEDTEIHSMPVIFSNGGDNKGKALRALAEVVGPNLFQNQRGDISNARKNIELYGRSLIVEWAEMKPLTDVESFKSAMTQQSDTDRAPYSLESVDIRRRWTLWGTSNRPAIITDPSMGEARRLWPLYIRKHAHIDLAGLEACVGHLWGEAVEIALETHERHYMDDRPEDAEAFDQWMAVIERCRVARPLDDAAWNYVFEWALDEDWMKHRETNEICAKLNLIDATTGVPDHNHWSALSKILEAHQLTPKKSSVGKRLRGWVMDAEARAKILEKAGVKPEPRSKGPVLKKVNV